MSAALREFIFFYEKNNFERSRRFRPGAYSPEPLRRVLSLLGNPQNSARVYHVGGTVAKGSISHFIAAYYREKGEMVGLYTSPHLMRLNERIIVNGQEISDEEFMSCFNTLRKNCAAEELSFFDALTAIAFLYFQKKAVTVSVIEVGIGGRLDSTNVVNPVAVFLGPVGMDHRNVLGSTLREIAQEKAGIIKPGIKVFSMRQQDEVVQIFKNTAALQGAELYFPQYPEMNDYREENRRFVSAALSILEKRQIDLPEIYVRGRFEKLCIKPEIIFDSAHNAPGMKSLGNILRKQYGKMPRVLYFRCMAERDPCELLEALEVGEETEIIFPDIPLAGCHSPESLQQKTENKGKAASLAQTRNMLKREDIIHIFCGTMQLYHPVHNLISFLNQEKK